MKKVMIVAAGICLAGAVIYQPMLLVVIAIIAIIGLVVAAVGVFTHD